MRVTRRGLHLVQAEEVLTGKGPAEFERLARTCAVDGPAHVGVLAVCVTLARRAARACVVPSLQFSLFEGLGALQKHLRLDHLQRAKHIAELSKARARCFQAAPAIEDATARAVTTAQKQLGGGEGGVSGPQTALDDHVVHVIERYTRLSAHHACAATCHALDAATSPAVALDVLEDTRGALAYQMTALGAARQLPLRAAALDQAQWERDRLRSELNVTALSLQIFHEYLGGRYRAYVEHERASQDRFIRWALAMDE